MRIEGQGFAGMHLRAASQGAVEKAVTAQQIERFGEVSLLVREAVATCRADLAFIGAFHGSRKNLEIITCFGAGRTLPALIPVSDEVRSSVFGFKHAFSSRDLLTDPRPAANEIWSWGAHLARAIMIAPLRSREGPLGLVAVSRDAPIPFVDREQAQLEHVATRARKVILEIRPGAGQLDAYGAQAPEPSAVLPHLTAREREIIGLLAADKSCKEVAAELSLSTRTVEHHVERLKFRCQQTTLHGLVSYLVRLGV